jgi:UDP-glucose 4-epimerase
LKPKIARSRELGKNADLDVLLPLDTGPEKLVLPYGSDGRPYMMHITDTRDTARGILLALESKTIPGDVFNIGSDEPVRFDRSIPEMGKLTGLEVVEARLPGAAVYYATSNRKARFHLGFRPEWDFSKMLTEAAAARPGRKQ